MNDPRLENFQAHLMRAIRPIAASPGRKRTMREEMLSHLLSSYQEELGRQADERTAVDTALQRLGNPEELQLQLQASVPFLERVLFLCLDRKETFMSRWLWIVGLVAWVLGSQLSFPHNEQLEFAGIAIFCGCAFWHLCQKDNIALRLIGPRWPWFAGCVAILFGTAVILPAMAKIKNEGVFAALSVESMALGALITLAGLGFLARAIKRLHAPSV
jgi:hypothetical protein